MSVYVCNFSTVQKWHINIVAFGWIMVFDIRVVHIFSPGLIAIFLVTSNVYTNSEHLSFSPCVCVCVSTLGRCCVHHCYWQPRREWTGESALSARKRRQRWPPRWGPTLNLSILQMIYKLHISTVHRTNSTPYRLACSWVTSRTLHTKSYMSSFANKNKTLPYYYITVFSCSIHSII